MDKEIDTDPFLSAVDKIRKEQTTRESKLKKR